MLKLGISQCTKALFCNLTKKAVPNVIKPEKLVLQTKQTVRHTSFFKKYDADALWKSMTSVSNAGKRRGRGRGGDKKIKTNLNLGKKIGVGSDRMVWPGLTCSILKANTLVKLHQLPPQETPNAANMKRKYIRKALPKLHPLERGWTGRSIAGRRIGPPDPFELETYNNFETIIIEHRLVATMTAIFGKKRRYSTLVVTGNRNGVIGIGKATRLDSRTSIRLAKNRAIKRLIPIDLLDETSVNHDFFCQFGRTKLYVYKKPKGFGLRCNRAIKACCELLGIKDLRAVLEGPPNYKNLLRAFIMGLMRQKTYQQIADEKKLHLVEFSEERYNYPVVLASPEKCLTIEEARKDPIGFEEYIMGNRVVENRPKMVPFYQKLPGWQTHLKRTSHLRNFDKVKIELLAEYGEYRSFLGDVYLECRAYKNPKKEVEEAE